MSGRPRKVWLRKRSTKKGKSYSLCWYEGARIRQEYAGRSKAAAERLRRQKEYHLATGTCDDVEPVPYDEFVAEHLAIGRATKAPSTVDMEKRVLERFGRRSGLTSIADIAPRIVEAYIRRRVTQDRISPHTANKELRILRAALNAARKRKYLRNNPAKDVPLLRAPEKPIRTLAPDELDALLEACPNDQWRTFIYLAASCGLRASELTNLQWSNIDLDEGLLLIQNTRTWSTKSRKNRIVGLTTKAVDMLRKMRRRTPHDEHVFVTREGNPWRNNVRRDFCKIVKRAGIPHCTIHDLRRTFCTELSKVVPPKDVQQLAGHASLDTTMKYYVANITIERAKAAAQKLKM